VLTSGQSPADGLGDLIIGTHGCLAVAEDVSLEKDARLVVVAADHSPWDVSGADLRGPGEGSDCTRTWRKELPLRSRAARVELPETLSREAIFVIPRRSGLRMFSGPPTRLSSQETGILLGVATPSLPTSWKRKDVLVHAYRYGPAGGQAAVELYIGRATLNPRGMVPPIKAISIHRVFLVAGRVLASEEYERVSGREERVDTMPPELTFVNWSVSDTERTVAFISTDDGGSWRRLSTDIGFEGINWVAQSLRDGLPVARWYLYTPH
jgi:hypothetical protein